MKVVADVETNGLNPDKIWVIVCREVDNPDNVHIFERPDLNPEALLEFSRSVDLWIGHYFLGFDHKQLTRLVPGFSVDPRNVLDTVIVSRLLNYNRKGGHSVENLAGGLGEVKVGKDITDWDTYTPLILDRCINDTLVQLKIYQSQLKYLNMENFKRAVETEHELQIISGKLSENGFPFHKESAERLLAELEDTLRPIDELIQSAFPPVQKEVGRIIPRLTQGGAINAVDFKRLIKYGYASREITVGQEYPLYETVEFNPASPKQIIERLNQAGWAPVEKTKGHIDAERELSLYQRSRKNQRSLDHASTLALLKARLENFRIYGWSASEKNLLTLPETAPEGARKLAERIMLQSRISDVKEWLALCKLGLDGVWRIFGNFMGIGSWTHRMAHQKPNMANIPVPKHREGETTFETYINEINGKMRALWYAPQGWKLVGTDADGIQMRIFAHLVNDPRLNEAIINGDKKNATDIHSVHRRALGEDICKSRDDAKTFIYAWLLGAGLAKIAEILMCSAAEARQANENFLAYYPGLKELKEKIIPNDASRGYFVGLDGRYVVCSSEHLMLAGYLQNGEKIIMARAAVQWTKELDARGITYVFVNFVHDEWQVLVPDDGVTEAIVSEAQIRAIRDQSEQLSMNIPLDGNSKSGLSWMDTH